jgi:hypothetical protein
MAVETKINFFLTVSEFWYLSQWMCQVCCISDKNCNIHVVPVPVHAIMSPLLCFLEGKSPKLATLVYCNNWISPSSAISQRTGTVWRQKFLRWLRIYRTEKMYGIKLRWKNLEPSRNFSMKSTGKWTKRRTLFFLYFNIENEHFKSSAIQ